MATTVQGIEKFHGLVGQHLGYSEWHRIDQDQINLFAEATGDHQWIHVDPERAKGGPFGATIAHGYLTLSLAPVLLGEVLVVEGASMGVNYGCNKVRFPSPVPVDSNLRLGVAVADGRGRHRRGAGGAGPHLRDRGVVQAQLRGPGGLPLLPLSAAAGTGARTVRAITPRV